MFWKLISPESPRSRNELRDYVRESLRIALEFATLGAYEQDEGEPEAGERDDEQRFVAGRRPCSGSRAVRPSAMAVRRQAPCAIGDAELLRCLQPTVPHRANPRLQAAAPLGQRRQRAGAVGVPEQPCLWAGR
jgi:hypothetical protein